MTPTPARSRSAARSTCARLPGLTIAKLAVGPMSNNAYLLRCTATGEGLLIDAANEADRLRGAGPAGRAAGVGDPDHPPAPRPLAGAGRRSPTTPAPRSIAGDEDADELAGRGRRAARSTATRSPSATSRSRSSRCAGTRRARSPCSTATPTGAPTCSPATRCSRAVSGKTTSPADFTSLIDDVEERVFDVLPDDDLVLPRPRRRLDARRRASAPGRVARARLVTDRDLGLAASGRRHVQDHQHS